MNGKYRRSGGKRYWRACPSCKVFVPVIPPPPPPPPPPTPQLLEGDLVIELQFSTVTLPVQLGSGQQIGVFWNWDGMDTQSLGTGITYTTGPVTSPDLSGPHPVVIRCTDWTCWKAAGITGNLRDQLLRILQWGNFESSEVDLFRECDFLTTTGEGVGVLMPMPSGPIPSAGAPTFSTTCAGCFAGCSALTTLTNAAAWTFVNVIDTSEMFRDCTVFNQDVTSWGSNMGNVRNMSDMFNGAAAFNNGGVAGTDLVWDVVNVTNMASMFNGAAAFNQLLAHPISLAAWQVGNVTDMSEMFAGATVFNQPLANQVLHPQLSWDVGNVRNMSGMFNGAAAFNNGSNGLIPFWLVWNVVNVTNMASMFNGAAAFNQLLIDLDPPFPPGSPIAWQVGNVTDMSDMFAGAAAFNNWNGVTGTDLVLDVGNVRSMARMFNNAAAFNQSLADPSLAAWQVGNVTDMSEMFSGATVFNQPLASQLPPQLNWDVGNVRNMSAMFHDAVAFNNGEVAGTNLVWLVWNVGNVRNMANMFNTARAFNQVLIDPSLLDPSGNAVPWQVGNVTDMTSMFKDADAFNQNLSDWDVGSVTSMEEMFKVALSFNNGGASLVLSNTQNVTNMKQMFCGAKAFNQEIDCSMQAVVNMIDFFKVCDAVMPIEMSLTQANYNAFLANIDAQILTLQTDVSFTGVTGNGAGIDPTLSLSYGSLTTVPPGWTIN